MLVRLVDIKGVEIWINPAYVRYVRRHNGKTEVGVQVPSRWGVPAAVQTDEPAESVVELLNSAMPAFFPSAPYDIESDEAQARRSSE